MVKPPEPTIHHSLKKSKIDWPQQPPTEKVLKFNMIFHDSTKNHFFQNIKIKINSRTCMALKSLVVIFQRPQNLYSLNNLNGLNDLSSLILLQ